MMSTLLLFAEAEPYVLVVRSEMYLRARLRSVDYRQISPLDNVRALCLQLCRRPPSH